MELPANAALGAGARLFIVDPDRPPTVPAWRAFIEGASAKPLPDIRSVLNGAIIFVEHGSRLWGLTFGSGHLFVNEDRAEPRLGLKTVLSIVQPDRLRAVGSRVHDDVVVRTERQVSRKTTREAFTIDDTRDILGAVTGEPADKNTWGAEVTGATALSVSIPIEVDGLIGLVDRVAAAHASDTYKASFGFIDSIEPVRDPELLSHLDAGLLAAVTDGRREDVYLAAPESIPYEDVAGFLYFRERRGSEHAELDLDDYRATVGPGVITVDHLRRQDVRVISASSGVELRTWSIYKCLVFETTVGPDTCILSEGEWFKLDRDFVARIDHDIAALPVVDLGLPPAARGEKEGAYNRRAAAAADLALLDSKLVRVGGTTIEVADLLSEMGQFIHVKRKTHSATLSHLFSQGRVAAQAVKSDRAVRQRTADLLTADGRREVAVMAEPFTATGKVIAFAVIAANATELPRKLPFFSRLNLWQASRFLTSTLDFTVVFTAIPIA